MFLFKRKVKFRKVKRVLCKDCRYVCKNMIFIFSVGKNEIVFKCLYKGNFLFNCKLCKEKNINLLCGDFKRKWWKFWIT